MANNLIFRAADASTAMEKVQNALGPDAYIIDISNVGNFVEITASKDEPIQRQPNKPVNPRKSLALAKRKLERFLPEDPRAPLPRTEHQSSPSAESSQGNSIVRQNELASREEFITENVFRDDEEPPTKSAPHSQGNSVQTPEKDPVKHEIPREASVLQLDQPSRPEPKRNDYASADTQSSALPKRSEVFVFGDLMNFGLTPAFIKNTFGLKEFDGSIPRSKFTETLVSALYEPRSASLIEDYGNLVFLGTPGSGKSTICAKLMHYFGTQYAEKPAVVHVTPEKLFEADRLRFHAKMFNFPFSRKYTLDNEALCQGNKQIVEIAWDFQMSFANYFAHHHQSYQSVKPFLVLSADINYHTLKEVLRVCPKVRTVILNKCDFGRFSTRNLMFLFEKGYKIASLSGDRSVSSPLDMADPVMLHGFVEYTLEL
ncbi:MAG: hypothetical protein ACO3NF_07640 [Paracoccaceae bacterium]